jgi:putative DNA primase/helicase
VVKVRILGRSEMPECESRTMTCATGNNVTYRGEVVRRGLTCTIETRVERPELREFKRDALAYAAANRGTFVAAALTVMRGFIAAGAPRVCGPLGSYAAWSRMVRSPLVWLGEPDPIVSIDAARAEDEELSSIREYFDLWENYGLDIDVDHTSNHVVEAARMRMDANGQLDLNPRTFEQFLFRVAADKNGNISAIRLGLWMRKISGRVVGGRRLVRGRDDRTAIATFRLERV